MRFPKGALISVIAALFVSLLGFGDPLVAQDAEGAVAVLIQGTGEFRLPPNADFQPMADSLHLPPEAELRTGPAGIVSLVYADGTEVTVRPGSSVRVGGRERSGVWVLLGQVLIRARRLLSSDSAREFRTPIAVAAIRGTEFLLSVDEATHTEVYVFEGVVAVANSQILDQEVLVSAGEMTRVEPLRPPLPPRPFRKEEVDRLGRLGALERGEDPVLEASQEPAFESYLAFPDVTLDAPRNPAYLGEVGGSRHSLFLSGAGYKEKDAIQSDGSTRFEDGVSGYGVMARGFSALSLEGGWTVGVSALGGRGMDESLLLRGGGTPSSDSYEKLTNSADQGEARLFLSRQTGNLTWGAMGGVRGSTIEVVDQFKAPPSPLGITTTTDNNVLSLGVGALFGAGSSRTMGISLIHNDLSATSKADDLRRENSGYDDVLEGLFRAQSPWGRWAALVQIERTKTSETVTVANQPFYQEDLSVLSFRAGPALGLTPTRSLALSLDLVGGVSFESAIQYQPSGSLREDEEDFRFSASLHFGMLYYASPSWVLVLDGAHRMERLQKDFTYPSDGVVHATRTETATDYVTQGAMGIGWIKGTSLVEYLVSGGGGSPGSLVHNLVLSMNWF